MNLRRGKLFTVLGNRPVMNNNVFAYIYAYIRKYLRILWKLFSETSYSIYVAAEIICIRILTRPNCKCELKLVSIVY